MTSVDISFDMVDITAKQDSEVSAANIQSFTSPGDLTLDGVYAVKCATLEENYWKLDGTFETFPDKPQWYSWGIWSSELSGADGLFSVPVILTVSFKNAHSITGIGFEFNPHDNSYCTDMTAVFYNGADTVASLDLTPDSWRYSIDTEIENFNKLEITFRKMNKPSRYLKLQALIYGKTVDFERTDITEALLLEEVDLTSSELTINTFDFGIYSENDDFNIFNPKGIYTDLRKKQQISVVGNINGATGGYGVFYIDNWKSTADKVLRLNTVDAVGIMDGTTFLGGMYNNIPVEELVQEIAKDAGFGYMIDSELIGTTLSGWLPACSHREALQQAAIAAGGYISTSRSGAVRLKSQPDYQNDPTYDITMKRKKIGTEVTLKTLVTGVNVTGHSYKLNTVEETLYQSSLSKGEYSIMFDEPVAVTQISGGTITESGVNWCTVSVSSEGEIVISGYKYTDNTNIARVRLKELPAGEKENILTLENATLVSTDNASRVADRIFSYHQKRIEQNMEYVLSNETVGGIADVEINLGVYRQGVIERMEIDMIGGYLTKAVIVGE